MDNDIQEYINKMRDAGKSDEEIKEDLLKVGWKEKDIPIQNQKTKPQPEKSKKKFSVVINLLIIIFIFFGFSSLILSFSIGGCVWTDVKLTINEVYPNGTSVDFGCASINVNGYEYAYGILENDLAPTIVGKTSPDYLFGRSDILIEGNTPEGNTFNAKGYIKYNIIGIFIGLLEYFWLSVLVLIVIKFVSNWNYKRKVKLLKV